MAERQRLVFLWARLGTSQDLAVDDVDKRLSASLADLVGALSGGTEAVAGPVGRGVMAASDPMRLEPGAPSLPEAVSDALSGSEPGVILGGAPSTPLIIASADVASQVDGSILGRIVVWTPLRVFLATSIPLALDAMELQGPDGTILLRGEDLPGPAEDFLWGEHPADTPAGVLRVRVGSPRSAVARRLRASGRQLVTLAAVFLLLALPAAGLVVRSGTSGLGRLTRAAQELDAVHPAPLPPPSPTAPREVRVLAGAISDMVDRLAEAREEVARTESLAAIGVLTKSLAHEIRTPLSVLRAGTEILARAPQAGSREREVSEMLQAEVERLSRLVDDLLVFGRPSPPEIQEMDLHLVCREVLPVLQDEAAERDVALEWVGEAVPMRGDPDQLRQVIVNLATNAIRACEPGGRVWIRTGTGEGTVVLEVEDDGTGIPPEVLPDIFKPLVTTHRTGNGLGLPIVRQLVEAHGGEIEVQSEVGRGTTMRVTIPGSRGETA